MIELEVAVGLRLVRDLLRLQPAPQVFVYGSADDERELSAWAEAGVTCIVTDAVALADLIESVVEAAKRPAPAPAVAAVVHQAAGRTTLRRDRSREPTQLTQRESDVLRLVALGLSNREVAETLCVELPTVKNHIQHLMKKLGVHRREEAVRYLRAVESETQLNSDVQLPVAMPATSQEAV